MNSSERASNSSGWVMGGIPAWGGAAAAARETILWPYHHAGLQQEHRCNNSQTSAA
jgi:hypothetical protein